MHVDQPLIPPAPSPHSTINAQCTLWPFFSFQKIMVITDRKMIGWMEVIKTHEINSLIQVVLQQCEDSKILCVPSCSVMHRWHHYLCVYSSQTAPLTKMILMISVHLDSRYINWKWKFDTWTLFVYLSSVLVNSAWITIRAHYDDMKCNNFVGAVHGFISRLW